MTKRQLSTVLTWIILGFTLFYLAYMKGWIMADFGSVSAAQAAQMLEHDTNVTLLDVRTPEEFGKEHIRGATLIPLQTLETQLNKLANVHDKTLIVYCQSGNRSVAASRILQRNGFTPLNLSGGISEWKAQGFPVLHP